MLLLTSACPPDLVVTISKTRLSILKMSLNLAFSAAILSSALHDASNTSRRLLPEASMDEPRDGRWLLA